MEDASGSNVLETYDIDEAKAKGLDKICDEEEIKTMRNEAGEAIYDSGKNLLEQAT